MWAVLWFGLGVQSAEAGRKPLAAPKDSVALIVDDVAPTPDGHVAFLSTEAHERIVPINVGESEAVAIAFRLAKKRHDRPLTHDLFDDAIRGLGGEVVQVHVHTFRDGIFHARVSVKQKRKLLHLDARASDSIALALGNGIPIWMSNDIYEDTGVSMEDLLRSLRQLDQPSGVPLR